MHYLIEMLVAFLILCGIVLFFQQTLKVNNGEGMLLSASAIALLFVVSSQAGTFRYGFYGMLCIAGIGILLSGIQIVRKKQKVVLLSPVLVFLFGLYAFALVTFYHDFIQHVDELHHWAAAVKYMVEKDAMPTGYDFLAGGGNYAFATSLFHLFFQKFIGYSEQGMYVSSFLLMWIGFLLPFSEYTWKDWKKVVFYIVLVYIALFSLYTYGVKSLYVDVPTAAWAGGLAGWWINRKKKKQNALIMVSGMIMLHFFKASAGLLMAVLVGMFMLSQSLFVEKGVAVKESGRKFVVKITAVLVGLVLLGSVGLFGIALGLHPVETTAAAETDETQVAEEPQQWELAGVQLPGGVSNMLNTVKLSRSKVTLTTGAFFTKSIGATMATKSNLTIAFLPFVFVILILFRISGELYHQRDRSLVYISYGIVSTLCYCAAVFFSYLFMFAYELSINMRSCTRYFSGFAIFLFVLVLTNLLQRKTPERKKIWEYLLLGMLAFFASGLNEKFIPNNTALDKVNTAGYEKLHTTKEEINRLEEIMTEADKVYYLCQYPADDLSGAELYNASVLYYLDGRISNYLQSPWKFTNTGCNIRLEEFDLSIADFPALLAQGGYTYVWVHTTNPYLTRELPLVLDCGDVADGYLYKVIYENGAAVRLEFVEALAGAQ